MHPYPDLIAGDQPTSGAKTWPGFAMMCIGMFMAILDVQVVATSLPTIQQALGIEPDQMSWVQTAYLIAEVIAIPLTGALTRILSMRWLFVISVSIFTVASTGCASSRSFDGLIAWRIVQGVSGGTLIPSVFSAVFLLFPLNRQGMATTIAGILAVLAPTIGPVVGGWITDALSWHWLFLINVAPGGVSAAAAALLLPRERARLSDVRSLDITALIFMAAGLATLEVALKEAPVHGWRSSYVLLLLVLAFGGVSAFVFKTLTSRAPIVDLQTFRNRNFAIGCALSFVLGMSLFGSIYLMPVFLAFVRHHTAIEIGSIMLVTGVAQLVTSPIAVKLEQRLDGRILTAFGFLLLTIGLGWSSYQTPRTDFIGMLGPQIVRGVSIMFCLLPPTRLALGELDAAHVPDASGLFNLMRNLGGAIGIALIDTVIFGRTKNHADTILTQLKAGDADVATFVGIPISALRSHSAASLSPQVQRILKSMVEAAATTQAINEAWMMLGALTFGALLLVPLARATKGAPIRFSRH